MFAEFLTHQLNQFAKKRFRRFYAIVFNAVELWLLERVWSKRAKMVEDLCPGGILKRLRVGFGK